MKKTDVLVIGGSAAGIVAAITGKSNYPDKKFLLVRKEGQVLVPCGIPYVFGTLPGSDKNIVPDAGLEKAGVELKIAKVSSVDQEKKTAKIDDGTEINFEKLVLATGSAPTIPAWLKGANLENVFVVPKNKTYLDEMLAKLDSCQKIVTIGAGFIGVEVSDELAKKGKDVTLIEILPHILIGADESGFTNFYPGFPCQVNIGAVTHAQNYRVGLNLFSVVQ